MAARKQQPTACGWCVSGNHGQCRGAIPRPPEGDQARESRCACADVEHRPDETLARLMARSLRPDLAQAGGTLLDEMTTHVMSTAAAFADSRTEAAA